MYALRSTFVPSPCNPDHHEAMDGVQTSRFGWTPLLAACSKGGEVDWIRQSRQETPREFMEKPWENHGNMVFFYQQKWGLHGIFLADGFYS